MSTLAANSHIICREAGYSLRDQQQQLLWGNGSSCCLLLRRNSVWFHPRNESFRKISNRDFRAEAFWPDMTRPTSIQMEPITDSDHLDQILLQAKDLSHLIIIDWMAAWCRKCIYLKPKLEKLAADFDPKFYCVDVNKVPQSLVKRGNISKMPTIQLWKDGEMKAEVIGGHKAWLVIEEVREMIQKFI